MHKYHKFNIGDRVKFDEATWLQDGTTTNPWGVAVLSDLVGTVVSNHYADTTGGGALIEWTIVGRKSTHCSWLIPAGDDIQIQVN